MARQYQQLHDQQWLETHARSMTDRQMAQEIGCAPESVRHARDQWGIYRRGTPDGYVSAREAARLLDKSHCTVVHWLERGMMRGHKQTGGRYGTWAIPWSEVERMQDRRGQ